MAARNSSIFQMDQTIKSPFLDSTNPSNPIPIPFISKVSNHYFLDADWSLPHVDQKTRDALGLKYGDDKATRFHNKLCLLSIKPGVVSKRNPSYCCQKCKRHHDDPECTITCYRKMRSKFNLASKKLEIRQTNSVKNGNLSSDSNPVYGIFVKQGQTIKKNEWIGEYVGRLIPPGFPPSERSHYVYDLPPSDRKYYDQNERLEPATRPELLRGVEIDSEQVGNWTRFMNHHCKPNVTPIDCQAGKIRMMAFRANRKITEGKEVFINYGSFYFSGRGWKCRCSRKSLPHTAI